MNRTRLTVDRIILAPIDVVFAAWADPVSMARWFSPTGRAEVVADVRVGGQFRIVMVGAGMEIEHTGEYLAVEPPRRLSFTWNSPYTGETPSVVTVALEPLGERTRLVLTHEGLPAATVAGHEGGWDAIVSQMETVVAGSTTTSSLEIEET